MGNLAVAIPDIKAIKSRLGMPPSKRGPNLVAFTEDQLRVMVEEAVGELALGLVEKRVRTLVKQYCGIRLRSEVDNAIKHRLRAEIQKLSELIEEGANADPEEAALPSWKTILDQVADKHGVKVHDILSARRAQPLAKVRFEAMYRMKTETLMSYPEIGRRLGGRHHSTVMHGVAQHAKRMEAQQP
jgi:chromosomal replication initiation ATPase DnaA